MNKKDKSTSTRDSGVLLDFFRIAQVEAPQRVVSMCEEIADDYAARFKHVAGIRDDLLDVFFENAPRLGRKHFQRTAFESYHEIAAGAEERVKLFCDWEGLYNDLTAIASEYMLFHNEDPTEPVAPPSIV